MTQMLDSLAVFVSRCNASSTAMSQKRRLTAPFFILTVWITATYESTRTKL